MIHRSFVDLFAGAGGLSLGLERAGFELRHAVEIDSAARASFLANRPLLSPGAVSADIRTIPKERIQSLVAQKVDLVAGGPPCQGFSEVGKRTGRDERNHLFHNFLEWVDELRPRAAIFENVRGMSVTAGGSFLRAVTRAFEDMDYDVMASVLTACDHGVPQLRRRIVIVAVSGAPPKAPLATSLPRTDRPPSVIDAIGDLPRVAPGEVRSHYSGPPGTILQQDLRGASLSVTDHKAANHPKSLVEAISHIEDGGNRTSIPDRLQPKSGFHNSYARLRSDKPAVAITSNLAKPSSARCIHPIQHRGLTAREGARLQTFPDSYEFRGGDVAKRLQIGNAVPPYLAELLGYYLRVNVFREKPSTRMRERQSVIKHGSTPLTAKLKAH